MKGKRIERNRKEDGEGQKKTNDIPRNICIYEKYWMI
jgi:hypothetical protein